MKILHTSDWHLGRSLYGRKRYDEFHQFLEWLNSTIRKEGVDVLLIAGDVFDSNTPSNHAQELYYRFLCSISGSCCRHIVVIGGNHDSPSFLNAPKELLKILKVHVVGAATENPEEEVIVLEDEGEEPCLIVCAVPYLRDRDLRSVVAGESIEDKNEKLVQGLRDHYAVVCDLAEKKQATLQGDGFNRVPIIAMGHLFTAGGRVTEGDGVRELYVGSLVHVTRDVFPATIDYLALGHLHVPQCVGDMEHLRYCGSPLPMGFGEAGQEKKVIIVELKQTAPEIRQLPVPCFQALERLSGSLDDIMTGIEKLKKDESKAWLEIEYSGAEIVGNLREMLEDALDNTSMEIRRIKNQRIMDRVLKKIEREETLDDLDEIDVFKRCLDTFEVPLQDRPGLMVSYNEIIQSLAEQDPNAQ